MEIGIPFFIAISVIELTTICFTILYIKDKHKIIRNIREAGGQPFLVQDVWIINKYYKYGMLCVL